MKNLPLAVNLLAYQLAWLACVFAAARQIPWLGLSVTLAAVGIHLLSAPEPRRELALIGITIAVGAVFESALLASGWVRTHDRLLMIALWGAFATTLNVAWRPLRRRPLVCALIAALGAPLAYQAGEKLGALEWVSAGRALLMISAGWAVLLPLLMRAARRFDGFAHP